MGEENREQKVQEVEELSAPTEGVVYEIVLKEGRKELERPSSSLFFSAVAAGLSMGPSFITEALLQTYLPKAQWTPLVSKFGYSVGFLLVILGRQQLFTENTLTPVIPLLLHKTGRNFAILLRLWAIVLFSNLLGSFLVAFACYHGHVFERRCRKASAPSASRRSSRNSPSYSCAASLPVGSLRCWFGFCRSPRWGASE